MHINATIIGQAITFAILIWFTMKFIWPPLVHALDERARKIAEGLASAEKAREELAKAADDSELVLIEAKHQAAQILAQTEKQRADMIQLARDEAATEGNRIKMNAQAELMLEIQQAKDALRLQVSELALAGAEQILRREIDAKSHASLLTKLQAEL